ncbi:hypothetical protein OD91_1605 [Lutibacter sp. Hel_I_33_5]|uniref:hypothetical protein n=1 Tax=Lutibacter sp. Hel_I_33_5 TaxID=1566289 RepID=UPI0011AA3D14|nr:hypothetical protein [Lutibacter sp. Hel_I_33_5]TVZ56321.1 hypothetical protein OD91_1605 [Lutibacter sp. Hel_I_33_5]
MKKFISLFIGLFIFYACAEDDELSYKYEFLKIDEYNVPASFKLGEIDSITVKYTLFGGCYQFNDLYYEYQDTARVVAITSVVFLDQPCTKELIKREHKFAVKATQKEDYLFRFWKGKDANDKNIFDDVVIPVN